MKIFSRLIKNREYCILFAIIIFAIFLRFYNLSSVPPSASLDEVSIGYNAYSILKTGVDEYGTKFPMLLRSYDDWRPALYAYLVIPFIQFFGLTVAAVRLPSIILSVLTVFATYFLVKKLFPNNKNIALLAAGFLAISPWHIYISRLGHEANAGLAFFIFGLTFFLRKSVYLSLFFFTLSFISYQSEKIFLPLFLVGLLFLFKKEVLEQKKKFLLAGLLSLVVLIPFIKATLDPNALIRFQATNIFNASSQRYIQESLLLADAVKNSDFPKQLVYNRRVVTLKIFLEGYIAHFNPQWLFFNNSEDRHKVPNIGLFYLWEAPLILIGFIFLVFQRLDYKVKLLLGFWIFFSPLSAAVTTDAPHALRTYTMLPAPQILAAFGIATFILHIPRKYILFIPFIVLFMFNFRYFFYNYFVVFPKTQSSSFQYALSKAVPYFLKNEKAYNKIIFSNKDNLYQSYMFFLYYSKYDPSIYQKHGGTKSGGFAQIHSFGKYEFRPIDWKREKKTEDVLYIGNASDFPDSSLAIKTFSLLDGKEVIKVILQK